LPDSIFSYQKIPIWAFLEGLGMENVGIPILRPFGIF
jgi:hypothetical protein